ncbi:hypothetical protein [Caproiciproducens galactitolivorans]|uniref:Uncharacterized protein n=1 Tax=Caproiciproducens galactitolivorans TaxID=642589 RepID=A0ABT4BZ62_9FIRM|nr:hypothetical protein [Caproiciproducens galactitolivorans]MCY1715211.1 hypothetical protein [Caproiciproducens galactitolivorans]
MPDSISIGFRRSVRCSDGKTRTGRVIYIHPNNIFAVLEFTGVTGKWRESIFLTGPENPKNYQDRDHPAFHRHVFTPEEDEKILKSKSDSKLAKEIGVKINVIWSHRALLKRRAQA